MARFKSAESIFIAAPVEERDRRLQLYVIFTDFERTQKALDAAHELARDLEARLVLLAAQVVPYPLPLESPPVSEQFTESIMSRLLREQEAEIEARIYLCRDRDQTIRRALGADSLVVIGTRGRWWPGGERKLARLLRRDGHHVILLDAKRARPAAVRLEHIPSSL
ncbi:MAG: universal stress protein [Acidobacteriia bacterium]|nr:universal stress protein [Terriglobia bacterium]